MNIKKADGKPMVIHIKEKAKLHVKAAPEAKIKGRNVLTVKRSSKIAGEKTEMGKPTTDKRKADGKETVQDKKSANPKSREPVSGKKESRQAAQSENSLRSRYLKTKKEKEAAIGKKSGSIRTAGAIGAGAALNQMEGGDELYESAQVMSALSKPAASAEEAGRRLFHSKAAKKQAERRIKKVNRAEKIGKKAVKDTAVKSAKKSAKETAKKAAKETEKKAAKETAKTAAKGAARAAGTVAGTATTGAGGFLIGAAAGEAVGMEMDKRDVKNSTRNRMIQLFIAKLRQEDSQDSAGKALKDIVMMRFAIVMKYVVKYAALFLLGLFALVVLVALPIIAVIAVIYNSPLAIFFPSISSGEATQDVLSAYVAEFNGNVDTELNRHPGYDRSEKVYVDFEGYGTPDNYYDILAVYMVRYGNGDTATDMTQKAKENLKIVFDDMCSYHISYGTETDEDGNETAYTVKYVNVSLKTYHDMILLYGFDSDETDMLLEIMKPENLAMLGYTEENGEPGQAAINEEQYHAIVDAVSDANGKKVVEFVLSKVGYPYSQPYRDTGNYYDCSSLAYYAWKHAGVNIMYEGSNTAASEGKYCYDNNYLVKYEEMQPGDLVFSSSTKNGRFMNISHVAVYVGNGMVVEAANERLGVVYREVRSKSSIVLIGRPR